MKKKMKKRESSFSLDHFAILSDKLEGSLKHFSLILSSCSVKNYVYLFDGKQRENNKQYSEIL